MLSAAELGLEAYYKAQVPEVIPARWAGTRAALMPRNIRFGLQEDKIWYEIFHEIQIFKFSNLHYS